MVVLVEHFQCQESRAWWTNKSSDGWWKWFFSLSCSASDLGGEIAEETDWMKIDWALGETDSLAAIQKCY